MKDLINYSRSRKKCFSSCLVTRKKGIKELLYEINGADMPQWNNEKETSLRIMVNLGMVLKEASLNSYLFMPGLQAKISCFNLPAVTQDRQKDTGRA